MKTLFKLFFVMFLASSAFGQGATCQSGYVCNGAETTNGDAVILYPPQDAATVVVNISGTWSGTISFKGSNGGVYVANTCTSQSAATTATTTTANDQWRCPVAGLTSFEAVSTASMTGSATVTVTASKGSPSLGGGGGSGTGFPVTTTVQVTSPGEINFATGSTLNLASGSTFSCAGTGCPAKTDLSNLANPTAMPAGQQLCSADTGTPCFVFTSNGIYLTSGTTLGTSGNHIGIAYIDSIVSANAPALIGVPGSAPTGCSASTIGCLYFSSTGHRPVYLYNAGSASNLLLQTDLVATSPLSLNGTTYSCPTCVSGPNSAVIGGIIGGFSGANTVGTTTSAVYSWFGSNTDGAGVAFGAPIWINNFTAVLKTSMGTGAYFQLGVNLFQGTSLGAYSTQLVIPNSSAAGAYQSPSDVLPVRIPSTVFSGMLQGGLSPTNEVVGSLEGFTANVINSATQPLGVSLNGNSVAGSTTVYTSPAQSSSTTTATAALVYDIAPSAFTASDVCVSLKGAAPSGGTQTVTLYDYPSPYTGGATATNLVVTVVASGGASTYCDLIDTASIGATDAYYFQYVNGSASTGPTLNGISMMTTMANGYTGQIIFGLGGQTMASASSVYFPAFASIAGSSSEATYEAAMPRALTASNLSCYVTTAPLTDANNLTVRQNAASPASGLTVQIPLLTTGLLQDVTHTISFANKDLFDLLDQQTAGTAPAVSSCSMAVN